MLALRRVRQHSTPYRGWTVFVSNHESQADPFLISFLPWEMKWLAKASLFRIPVAGWSMALAGDVPIRRGNDRSASEAMGQCARWLERGVPVVISPTRSPDGKWERSRTAPSGLPSIAAPR
jgi:1-acyl-sn-glycerol-3-phosphate acyltransferase